MGDNLEQRNVNNVSSGLSTFPIDNVLTLMSLFIIVIVLKLAACRMFVDVQTVEVQLKHWAKSTVTSLDTSPPHEQKCKYSEETTEK